MVYNWSQSRPVHRDPQMTQMNADKKERLETGGWLGVGGCHRGMILSRDPEGLSRPEQCQ